MAKGKRLISLVLILMMCVALAACGQSAPAQTSGSSASAQPSSQPAAEKIKIRFMSGLWDQTRKTIHEYIQKGAAEQFPNVEVEWELTGTSGDWLNKLKTYNATGDMPDVFFMAGSISFPVINAGHVIDLKPYADKDGFITKNYPDEKSAGVTTEGKLYAFDEGLDYYFRPALFYNKKLFADAGITELPKTWDEFLKVCETFKQKGIIPISMADKDSSEFTYFFYQMMLALDNPQVVDDILAGKTDFSNPASIAALNRVRDLVNKGYFPQDITSLDYGAAMELFNSDQAAIYTQMSWDIGGFKNNDNVGMLSWPQINTNVNPQDITLVWTPPNSGYAVYSKTANVDIAVKFAEMSAVQAAKGAAEQLAQPSILKTGIDVAPKLSELAKTNLEIHNAAKIKQFTFGNHYFSSKMFAEFGKLGSQLLTGQYSAEQFAQEIAPVWANNQNDIEGK